MFNIRLTDSCIIFLIHACIVFCWCSWSQTKVNTFYSMCITQYNIILLFTIHPSIHLTVFFSSYHVYIPMLRNLTKHETCHRCCIPLKHIQCKIKECAVELIPCKQLLVNCQLSCYFTSLKLVSYFFYRFF